MAPIRHESGGAAISPAGLEPNPRARKEGTGTPADGTKTPCRDGRKGGEGTPRVGPLSGEGGMDSDTRVVP